MPVAAIGIVFLDSACTTKVASASIVCGEPTTPYAKTYNTAQDACSAVSPPDSWHYFGAKLPISFAYRINGGSCVSYNPAGVAYYELGPEVDYTQFAAMTLEHE
jgi:hypothetical protein